MEQMTFNLSQFSTGQIKAKNKSFQRKNMLQIFYCSCEQIRLVENGF
jgi:hypothetical protein